MFPLVMVFIWKWVSYAAQIISPANRFMTHVNQPWGGEVDYLVDPPIIYFTGNELNDIPLIFKKFSFHANNFQNKCHIL